MITAEELRAILSYDPETGQFVWRAKRGRIPAGSIAGGIDYKGYHNIRINNKIYRSARLAVLYMIGRWPLAEVDHENRVRDDNRWLNLREATRSQNVASRRTVNSTGFKGVALHRKTGLYRAEIRKNGICRSLGYFKTPAEAHEAYVAEAKIVYGEFFKAA